MVSATNVHFAVLTLISGGGLTTLVTMLWRIKGAWDTTNNKLERLIERVDERDGQLERRMDGHERGHALPRRGRWLP